MPSRPHRFRKEIYAIVIIKLVVILGLWWAFVRDAQVDVDQAAIARHLAHPVVSDRPMHHTGEAHAQ